MMYIPLQFRLKKPYQNSPQVRVQLLDSFGNLLADARVPQPEQTFTVVEGFNRLAFAVQEGPYLLMDVRFRISSGEAYSPCQSLSLPQVISVPARPAGPVPYLTFQGADCSQTPYLTFQGAECSVTS